MSRKSIVVSTTHELAGWRITAHLDIVTAHVVAGTGAVADFFASVTDFVGGRSGAYQNHLAEINREVVVLLKDRASELGAEGIVGLRIDHSEVSGKGKAMLMVSAVGTAVRAEVESEEAQAAAEAIGVMERGAPEGQWKCRCGTLNDAAETTCTECGRVPGAIY